MTFVRGGRGLKAPYETTHLRVPVPLKERIQALIDDYKQTLDSQVDPDMENMLSLDEAIELAQHILNQKKSARISMQKLLTGIYNSDIVL